MICFFGLVHAVLPNDLRYDNVQGTLVVAHLVIDLYSLQ